MYINYQNIRTDCDKLHSLRNHNLMQHSVFEYIQQKYIFYMMKINSRKKLYALCVIYILFKISNIVLTLIYKLVSNLQHNFQLFNQVNLHFQHYCSCLKNSYHIILCKINHFFCRYIGYFHNINCIHILLFSIMTEVLGHYPIFWGKR